MDVGDFDGAISLLNEARRTNPTDQDLRGAETYVSQLMAQKRERESTLSDQEKARRLSTIRTNGRRDAAWTLGLHLSDYGDNYGAIFYFLEARQDFPLESYNYRLLGKLIENVNTLGTVNEFPLFHSKADALLDALQYGDGSLDRSVRYLEEAFKANPGNLFISEALNYVQGMSVSEEK